MITWIQTHWVDILALYAAIVTAASIIVKLTPTQADDAILKKIIDFISKWVALNKQS